MRAIAGMAAETPLPGWPIEERPSSVNLIAIPVPDERSVYRQQRLNPSAFAASVAIIVAAAAGLATISVVAEHVERTRLTTIDVEELAVTPPPPEPAAPDTATALAPPVVTPPPMIEMPRPGPVQVISLEPAPPVLLPTVTQGVKSDRPPSPRPAPPAAAAKGGDLTSNVLFAEPPVYPVAARRAHEQGTVRLALLVGTDGTVKTIEIAASSGSRLLDRAALQAVRRWRWSPMHVSGVAVAVKGYVTIPFILTL